MRFILPIITFGALVTVFAHAEDCTIDKVTLASGAQVAVHDCKCSDHWEYGADQLGPDQVRPNRCHVIFHRFSCVRNDDNGTQVFVAYGNGDKNRPWQCDVRDDNSGFEDINRAKACLQEVNQGIKNRKRFVYDNNPGIDGAVAKTDAQLSEAGSTQQSYVKELYGK